MAFGTSLSDSLSCAIYKLPALSLLLLLPQILPDFSPFNFSNLFFLTCLFFVSPLTKLLEEKVCLDHLFPVNFAIWIRLFRIRNNQSVFSSGKWKFRDFLGDYCYIIYDYHQVRLQLSLNRFGSGHWSWFCFLLFAVCDVVASVWLRFWSVMKPLCIIIFC